MNLITTLPNPDLDSRLIWSTTRLCEYREGSIPRHIAFFVWGLVVGWGLASANSYEKGQYLRIANAFEKELNAS